jgi:hypothetical protein
LENLASKGQANLPDLFHGCAQGPICAGDAAQSQRPVCPDLSGWERGMVGVLMNALGNKLLGHRCEFLGNEITENGFM